MVVIAGFFVAGLANEAIAKRQLFEAYKRVIAIDPGHGGDETGAKGPDGTTEKAVALSLAQILAAELQREYRVVLTRTDDIQADLDERTALANHHKADLFISIHTGGSFVHSTSGIFIYHYQDFDEDPRKRTDNILIQGQDKNTPILWNHVQSRHLEKSRILAHLINIRLNDSSIDKESRVQGAPLLVLQGTNMPAILIEIGYLSNPSEEKQLRDQRFLTDLAKEISRGIDEYFERTP
ncbi:N-acetylmuramoyl-L-alanine amidase (EC [Olavius sp. associated proteobacterium Delta 1]|nr:N-acetylmuramoyl-L-alanine amidase (EC [Olavius sp. associated proteobacterium Delta 1]